MSYFSRLVQQSQLEIGGGRGAVAGAGESAGFGLETGPGRSGGELVEIDAWSEAMRGPAPLASAPESPQAALGVPSEPPGPGDSGAASMAASAGHEVVRIPGRPSGVSADSMAAVGEPASRSDRHVAPSPDAPTGPQVMRRVMRWIASGPQPEASHPGGTAAGPVKEAGGEPGRSGPPAGVPAALEDVRVLEAPAESPPRAGRASLPVVKAAPEVLGADAGPLDAHREGDAVQVSIGSISVRIEGPAGEAPQARLPVTPVQSARRERQALPPPRLSRFYVR